MKKRVISINESCIRRIISEVICTYASPCDQIEAGEVLFCGCCGNADNYNLGNFDDGYEVEVSIDNVDAEEYALLAAENENDTPMVVELKVKQALSCPNERYYIDAAIKNGVIPDGQYNSLEDVYNVYGDSTIWCYMYDYDMLDNTDSYDIILYGGDRRILTQRGLKKVEAINAYTPEDYCE